MAIRLLIDNSESGYLAIDAAVLVEAFERALNELGLVDRNDPAALVVANCIIALAKAGVLDPVRLRHLTVKAIRQEQRHPVNPSQPRIESATAGSNLLPIARHYQ